MSSSSISTPSKYYYLGDTWIASTASAFSTSEANCPIIQYACEKVISGSLLGVSCDYTDTDTQVTFDTVTGDFTFTSTDENSPEYPANTVSTYDFYIKAYANIAEDLSVS